MNGRHSGAPGRRVGPTTSPIFQFAIEPSSYAGDTSVRLFGDVIFFIRIVGIMAERSSRSSEKIGILGDGQT